MTVISGGVALLGPVTPCRAHEIKINRGAHYGIQASPYFVEQPWYRTRDGHKSRDYLYKNHLCIFKHPQLRDGLVPIASTLFVGTVPAGSADPFFS